MTNSVVGILQRKYNLRRPLCCVPGVRNESRRKKQKGDDGESLSGKGKQEKSTQQENEHPHQVSNTETVKTPTRAREGGRSTGQQAEAITCQKGKEQSVGADDAEPAREGAVVRHHSTLGTLPRRQRVERVPEKENISKNGRD